MRTVHLQPGIVVPLMPFLTEDQKYDFSAVEKQVEHYINSGVAGIFVLTTCGQSPLFPLEENKDLATAVLERVGKRVPVYVGIGRTKVEQPRYSQEMLEHAMRKDADAAVALCWDYAPEEQVAYFRDLNQSGFPIIAYSLGNQQKQLQQLEEIASLDSIVGMKVTIDIRDEQNKNYFRRAVATGKDLFMGEDVVLYEGLELGAVGGVNAMANLIPQELVSLYTEFQSGNRDKARQRQQWMNKTLLSILYYGKDIQGNPLDAASALQNAMHQVFSYGSPVMKAPKPTYAAREQELIQKALEEYKRWGKF